MYINANSYKHLESDSKMIQAAIDEASLSGKSVLIPKYNERTGRDIWNIAETLYLHSESVILLQNCHLRLADGAVCHMFSNSNAKKPIALTEEGTQRNITIQGIGKALLDGGIHNGIYEDNGISRKVVKPSEHKAYENCMCYFQKVENLKIDNITVKDHRYWAIALFTTTYSRISNIHFISSSNVPNQDGIDLLKGCHDCIIENITGYTGDNMVALLATADDIYGDVVNNVREGDVYNITVRNIMAHSVGGCSIVRLLCHDGYKIYNIRIDNLIETSPWSEKDSNVAPNPDLNITTDSEGNIIRRHLTVGEEGYRCESAIIIGESYWYKNFKAQSGDMYGISVSNVMTHARYAIFLNNTVLDSSFENIRLFGNGYMAVYFGEGEMERLRFSNISYDKNARPHKDDEHIYIDWNKTRSDGLSCVYFNTTKVSDIEFDGIHCAEGISSVFGGNGNGTVTCSRIIKNGVPTLSCAKGITIEENK